MPFEALDHDYAFIWNRDDQLRIKHLKLVLIKVEKVQDRKLVAS